MKLAYISRTQWILILLLISSQAFPTENKPFQESVIIFNTICAKCHEAQCSGRASFGDAYEASIEHIVRHYNQASEKKWLQKELFSILNHMKEKCAYYPMSAPVPPQRIWNSEILGKMSTLVEKNYFVPVGPLLPGTYRLELSLAKDEKVTVHFVSEIFDTVIEDCFLASEKQIVIPITIEDAGKYYVRVYPRNPVQITRLAIITVDSH
ncbi:MAG: hypothetical protein OQL06_05235 [Gammaproteobacteria bacterium]|nr:hypothetical protein [Gammaproteobacteria bacterium]